MNSLTILLPYSEIHSAVYSGCIYHYHTDGVYVAYFINTRNNYSLVERPDRKNIIGSCSKKTFMNSQGNYLRWMPGYSKVQLFLEGKEIIVTESRVVLYNLKEVMDSQTIAQLDQHEDLDYISTLYRLIHESDSATELSNLSFHLPCSPKWMAFSMFLQHLFWYVYLLKWLVKGFKRSNKLQISQVNYALTIMLDLLLGYTFLHLLSQFNVHYSSFFMGMLEKLVNSLHSLLKWLMGSPAGLKLNNAFNKMLGKYFSYHIQLWWIFLGKIRLFNLQVSGLTALMRLFLGRKYNPLRGGVDSCEYTNQELFVGTVAFTILLLLLPTTAMYYTVFTLLRLLSLGVQHCLATLVYCIQTLPLHQSFLWLLRSSKVKGNIFMETVNMKETPRLSFRIKLQTKSLKELIAMSLPPVTKPKSVDFSQLLYNLFTGKQIL